MPAKRHIILWPHNLGGGFAQLFQDLAKKIPYRANTNTNGYVTIHWSSRDKRGSCDADHFHTVFKRPRYAGQSTHIWVGHIRYRSRADPYRMFGGACASP